MHSIKGVVDSDGKPPQIFESKSESELSVPMDELRTMKSSTEDGSASGRDAGKKEGKKEGKEGKKKPSLKLKLGEMKTNKDA